MNSVSKNKLMKLNKDFITEENSKKLLDSILLSIKSSEGTRLITNEEKESKNSRNYQFIETNDIRTKKEENSIISGFSISINRFEEHRWFSQNVYKYELSLNTMNDRGYSSTKYETLINNHQEIIEKIYDFLIDLERNKKIEETNKTLETIIGDISTTIEKKYRRDETINEILN